MYLTGTSKQTVQEDALVTNEDLGVKTNVESGARNSDPVGATDDDPSVPAIGMGKVSSGDLNKNMFDFFIWLMHY